MKITAPFIFLFFTFLFPLSLGATEPPREEIRAVWLTTIFGLDWPKKPASTAQEVQRQKQELVGILDRLADANFNMVFIQTRLRGDVIYPSAIEPFNKVFTGKHNRKPPYDPLRFVIEECHKRGMECHAWFVTFPLGTEKAVREQGSTSVVKKYPKMVRKHQGEWYMDPGVPETAIYLTSLVRELVAGYDLDGIHFDYIRYPDKAQHFQDRSLYRQYGKGKTLAEWRRENINRLVTQLYDEVKRIKPWVQVSSSPLGKYNRIEKVPNAGWTAYETVFQDPKRWMEEGKHDMIVPMMYYLHDNFFPFVDNWGENSNGRPVVPGLGAYRMDRQEADWSLSDLTEQIDYCRRYGSSGCAYFRCEHLVNNPKGLYTELKNNYYQYPAKLPPLTWLDTRIPAAPEEVKVEKEENGLKLSWQKPTDEQEELTYTLYYSLKDSIDTASAHNILTTGLRSTEILLPVPSGTEAGYLFQVTSSTRYHIESEPSRETYYYLSEFVK